MLSRFAVLVSLLVWLVAGVHSARADQSYEWQRTTRLLTKLGLEVDSAPEGKRIAWTRIVRDEVFVEDEVWPAWFNWFHWTTREEVVARELLFHPGDALDPARIEETMRNLRGMGTFALVRIVPVRTGRPDEVGVLVHTRDLWSLRFEWAYNLTTRLDSLLLRGTERNAFGRNKVAGVEYRLIPKSYSVGEDYYARRVWGSSVELDQQGGLAFHRQTGRREGSFAAISLGQPFRNLGQRYAWTLAGSYDTRVIRAVRDGEVQPYPSPIEGEEQGQPSAALSVWRRRYRAASLLGQIRRGDRFKQTFSLGWDYRFLQGSATSETNLPTSLREAFARDVLPRPRTESGPLLGYQLFVPRWATFVNLSTFGQSENVRVGPWLTSSLRVPRRAFGSSTDSWVVSSALGFTAAPAKYLVDVSASRRLRYERGARVDQLSILMLRGATPMISSFRLVARAAYEWRLRDTSNTLVSLGGDNGLRGYVNQALYGYGASRLLVNFELRSAPIEWEAVHLGGVVFYDIGRLYGRVNDDALRHSIGIGLRLLFPQFNRSPYSFDVGVVDHPAPGVVPTISTGQVVPMTAIEDPI